MIGEQHCYAPPNYVALDLPRALVIWYPRPGAPKQKKIHCDEVGVLYITGDLGGGGGGLPNIKP